MCNEFLGYTVKKMVYILTIFMFKNMDAQKCLILAYYDFQDLNSKITIKWMIFGCRLTAPE